jgi:hypothetical protein
LPLHQAMPLRPLPDEPELVLRPGVATPRVRSALAVPPGFDGFLRSRSRPSRDISLWHLAGLLRPAAGHGVRHVSVCAVRDPKIAPAPILDGATPFEAFPSPTGDRSSPRFPAFTDRSCPLAVSTTSGLCSAGESVVATRRCRPAPPDAPMGFCADPCSVSHRPGRNPGVVVIAAA